MSILLLCRVEGRKVEAEMGPHHRGWALAMVKGSVERKVEKEGRGAPCQRWGSDLVCVQVTGLCLQSSPQTRELGHPGSL